MPRMTFTLQMPNYATLSDTPSIFDDKAMGYAGFYFHHQIYLGAAYGILVVASLLISIGLSTPLFVTIVESIETTEKGKPKLYYHFWSSALLIFLGIWGYEVLYQGLITKSQTVSPYYYLYSFLTYAMMLIQSSCGAMIAMCAAARGGDLFSVPISEFCCSEKCRICWLWFMTVVGFSIFLSLISYLLYAIPTIVLVYYLYPVRTLIRTPFIISAIFYTIAFLSLALYQFEKVCMVFFIRCKCRCIELEDDAYSPLDHDSEHSESVNDGSIQDDNPKVDETGLLKPPRNLRDLRLMLDMFETRTKSRILSNPIKSYRERISYGIIIVIRTCCRFDKFKIALQHKENQKYYAAKLHEDLKITYGACHLLIAVIQMMAVLIILIAFVFGELYCWQIWSSSEQMMRILTVY